MKLRGENEFNNAPLPRQGQTRLGGSESCALLVIDGVGGGLRFMKVENSVLPSVALSTLS